MTPRPAPGSRGFTLLELLVAMAIFAILGTLALSGYTELQRQSEYAEQRLQRLREVQRAMQTIAQDLGQIEPRPVREPLGETVLPAVLATESIEYGLQFTRSGWSNTAGLPRPTLQRVGYRLDGEGLWRDHWPVLDRTLATEPTRVRLLEGVRDVRFRFMTPSRDWVERWPTTASASPAVNVCARPRSRSRSTWRTGVRSVA
jgi:general secretion pathway protein J